jgi:hypothetical protein
VTATWLVAKDSLSCLKMAPGKGTLFQVTPPEPFSFSTPSDWPKYRRRFERFRIVSGLNSKSEEEQVNAPIYLMGDAAEDIVLSFGLSAKNLKKYEEVL